MTSALDGPQRPKALASAGTPSPRQTASFSAFNREPYYRAPLGPRAVVDPHLVPPEQAGEHEPTERSAVTQSAGGHHLLPVCHADHGELRPQFVGRLECSVILQEPLDR